MNEITELQLHYVRNRKYILEADWVVLVAGTKITVPKYTPIDLNKLPFCLNLIFNQNPEAMFNIFLLYYQIKKDNYYSRSKQLSILALLLDSYNINELKQILYYYCIKWFGGKYNES